MKNPYDAMNSMTVAELGRGMVAQALVFVILGLGLWWLADRKLSAFITVTLPEIGMGIALGGALIGVAAGLYKRFPDFAEGLVKKQALNFAFLEKRLSMPMIVLLSVCAGVGEEALFRGGLQTLIGEYAPLIAAIIVSSLAFTLIHFASAAIAIIIFGIGALFGGFYAWSGSLLCVMIAHTIYDVYAFWNLQNELHRLKLFEPTPDALDLGARDD